MARPSVGLQSLWELAASAKRNKLREASEPPEERRTSKVNFSDHGENFKSSSFENPLKTTKKSTKSSTHNNIQGHGSVESRRNSDIGTIQRQSHQLMPMDQDLSHAQRTYVLQNQALARNNSVLMSRILEMEARLNNLVNENMALRTLRNSKDVEVRKEVEALLRYVELEVLGKVGEICQVLATVRHRDRLPENPTLKQVALLVGSSAPATSTPIEGASRPDMLQEFHELEMSMPAPSDFKGSLAIPEAQLTSVRPDADTSCDEANETVMEGITASTAPQSRPSTSAICESIDSSKPGLQLLEEIGAYAETDSSDREMPEPAQKTPNPKSKTKPDSNSKSRRTNAKASAKASATTNTKSQSNAKTQKRADVPHPSNESNPVRPTLNESLSPPRRRNRKSVSYVMPSLRAKMRRESAKFIDAVVDVKQEPSLSPVPEANPKRKALSDVTNSNNKRKPGNKRRKATAAFSLDGENHSKRPERSVFDFTDANDVISMHRQ